jgi:hypothetical protein
VYPHTVRYELDQKARSGWGNTVMVCAHPIPSDAVLLVSEAARQCHCARAKPKPLATAVACRRYYRTAVSTRDNGWVSAAVVHSALDCAATQSKALLSRAATVSGRVSAAQCVPCRWELEPAARGRT